ncbi:MAG: TonB-dependent receptor [Bacteroidetes bacterium]|nr:TonB-dependent receptor [Bacteroidota bacterium]
MKPLNFLFFILIPLSGFSQNLAGIVKDKTTGKPVPDAAVVQTGTRNGTATGNDGRFTISLDDQALQKIQVTCIGYQTAEARVKRDAATITVYLIPADVQASEVLVEGYRVTESAPIAHITLDAADLKTINFGQDIPVLLTMTPSLVSTSDAGGGVGYTGLRIRGVDPGRINVTLNGIPWNDAESHNVYWVDLPDLISSADNIQIQRGIGTSTNGPASFGATIDLKTIRFVPEPYSETSVSHGSFNTKRANFRFGTGLFPSGWSVNTSFSKITSDGYIDRASSDLKSAYFSASRSDDNSLLSVNLILGRENTYQAWNGVPEAAAKGDKKGTQAYITRNYLSSADSAYLMKAGRTYNAYSYDNQVDDYGQDHYQVLYSWTPVKEVTLDFAAFFVKGRGYYEQFKPDASLSDHRIQPVIFSPGDTVFASDLIRRKWLDNEFYGVLASGSSLISDQFSLIAGGGVSVYDGDHFGEVIWSRVAGNSEIRHRFYEDNGRKLDGNVFVKLNFSPLSGIQSFADVQIRTISYRFLGLDDAGLPDRMTRDYLFINPKAGLTVTLTESSAVYAGLGIAGKEPSRSDFTDTRASQQPRQEFLYDLETGYRYNGDNQAFSANFYGMVYKDQMVLTGKLNDVGDPLRQNVASSYRVGAEFTGSVQVSEWARLAGNLTAGKSAIREFREVISNYDTGGEEIRIYRNQPVSFSPGIIAGLTGELNLEPVKLLLNTKYVSRQYLDNTGSREKSLDPFITTDFFFSLAPAEISGFSSVSLQAGILNLLNEQYESNGYTYSYIYNTENITENFLYPQAGRNYLIKLQVSF